MGIQTFIAKNGETEQTISVDAKGGGQYIVELDGTRHEVDARRFAGGTWSLLIDGQSYDVELEVAGEHESDGKYNALIRGQTLSTTLQDERHVRMALTSGKFTVQGPQTIRCPMPGKIVKILVEENQEVEENQPVIIVEAMKMENELRSPKAGRIRAILVGEGQAVESGAKLISVD